ncbi:glycine cleavage system protein GcvH [Prochlorothrix hollandica]|uniref:Glycine cleavage system H protein n=1 Tax=Prochlorothrix hollandica PCC 9006 = CALU 1027 TaxID=317619 RepID=A0A0M2PVX8_PROHO|nr:glycine cleavage system protein GcvH [Prochlorothrix hollandica]KKJ00310.1 glycine cleavage system protein H [Prochlorothrix hollandica PCC 9006 = CALU 1027]
MALDYPQSLKYADSHEYLHLNGDMATIGITAFAIQELGDLVFVDLPEVGSTLTQGEKFGDVESVKAVGELYAPVSGEVVERNEAAIEAPDSLQADPYGQGWLLKVRCGTDPDLAHLMGADDYRAKVGG